MSTIINETTMKRIETLAAKSKLDINDYLNNILDETEDNGALSAEYIDELNKLADEVRNGDYVSLDEL